MSSSSQKFQEEAKFKLRFKVRGKENWAGGVCVCVMFLVKGIASLKTYKGENH